MKTYTSSKHNRKAGVLLGVGVGLIIGAATANVGIGIAIAVVLSLVFSRGTQCHRTPHDID
ncbi:hypothetical protein ACOYR1_16410 [Thalassotalea piscium]